MEIDFSGFGEVPRTASTILKLLRTSLHEVNNIVNAINNGGEDRRVALDRVSFRGAEIALLPYKELLTMDYRVCRSVSIDKTFEEFKSSWSQLIQSVVKTLPAKKEVHQFAAAWHKANDELCDILELRKGRTEESELIYGDFISSLDTVAMLMARQKITAHKSRMKRTRSKQGELSQEDVAKVFRTTRQTIIRWEKNQTEDGPGNKSNKWGYYKSLRTNPELRNAFEILSNATTAYFVAKDKATREGNRFRITFEKFNEAWGKHSNCEDATS